MLYDEKYCITAKSVSNSSIINRLAVCIYYIKNIYIIIKIKML